MKRALTGVIAAAFVFTGAALAKNASDFDVGETVAISGLGENRRATVLRIDSYKNNVKVQFHHNGFSEWISANRLLSNGESWSDDMAETAVWTVLAVCLFAPEQCQDAQKPAQPSRTHTIQKPKARRLSVKNNCRHDVSARFVYESNGNLYHSSKNFIRSGAYVYVSSGPNAHLKSDNIDSIHLHAVGSNVVWSGDKNFTIEGKSVRMTKPNLRVDERGDFDMSLTCDAA